jgi:hypothetical protein
MQLEKKWNEIIVIDFLTVYLFLINLQGQKNNQIQN